MTAYKLLKILRAKIYDFSLFVMSLVSAFSNSRIIVDCSGTMKDSIIGVIALILDISLMPVVVTQIQGVNTTLWTFTGYEGAKTLLLLVPFVFVAGLLIKTIIDAIRGE